MQPQGECGPNQLLSRWERRWNAENLCEWKEFSRNWFLINSVYECDKMWRNLGDPVHGAMNSPSSPVESCRRRLADKFLQFTIGKSIKESPTPSKLSQCHPPSVSCRKTSRNRGNRISLCLWQIKNESHAPAKLVGYFGVCYFFLFGKISASIAFLRRRK